MKLFINSGVCKRMWNDNVKIRNLPNGKTKISIPNYLGEVREQEFINFILPSIAKKDLKKGIVVEYVKWSQTRRNTYVFDKHLDLGNETCIYAIIRNTEIVPDDVFIPANKKDCVTVLKRMRFVDSEADLGDFLSNVYFIKIKLDSNDSLPVYITTTQPSVLDEHYVFYREPWNNQYYVTDIMETYIRINRKNKDEYISLSTLCK